MILKYIRILTLKSNLNLQPSYLSLGLVFMFLPLIYVCPYFKQHKCIKVMEFSKYVMVTIFVPKREFGNLTNITALIFKIHFLSSFPNKPPDLPCH